MRSSLFMSRRGKRREFSQGSDGSHPSATEVPPRGPRTRSPSSPQLPQWFARRRAENDFRQRAAEAPGSSDASEPNHFRATVHESPHATTLCTSAHAPRPTAPASAPAPAPARASSAYSGSREAVRASSRRRTTVSPPACLTVSRCGQAGGCDATPAAVPSARVKLQRSAERSRAAGSAHPARLHEDIGSAPRTTPTQAPHAGGRSPHTRDSASPRRGVANPPGRRASAVRARPSRARGWREGACWLRGWSLGRAAL